MWLMANYRYNILQIWLYYYSLSTEIDLSLQTYHANLYNKIYS